MEFNELVNCFFSDTGPYHTDYVGCWEMIGHDKDDLTRQWFENWKDKKEDYLCAYEFVTIEEVKVQLRRKEVTRYRGTISSDGCPWTRTIDFDLSAPPPPAFMIPAKFKYEPPPLRVITPTYAEYIDYGSMDSMSIYGSIGPFTRSRVITMSPYRPNQLVRTGNATTHQTDRSPKTSKNLPT